MSNRKQRFVFGVAATLVGALIFVVASSYLVFRGQPLWLAGAVGALAFPVLPVTWHLLGERSRRRKQAAAKAATLTAGDRYWLRFVVVALLVIGPMVAIGKLDVVRAVWRHGLWLVHTHDDVRTLDVFGTPLARVPSEAELVLLVNAPGEGSAVFAYGNRQMMIFAEGKQLVTDAEIAEDIPEINETSAELKWLPTEEIALIKNTDTEVVAASAGWRARAELPGMGPSAKLLHELGRSPEGAYIVLAFVPTTTRDVLPIRAGAMWLSQSGEKYMLEGRIEALDEAAAKELVDDATSMFTETAQDASHECRKQLAAIFMRIKVVQRGALVTGRVEIDDSELSALIDCL